MVTNEGAIERNTIRINDDYYRVDGRVNQFLVSKQPGKITVGEYTEASNPMASEWTVSDFRDGLGVNRASLPDDQHRVWWATGQIRFKDSFILPRLATQTAAGPASGVDTLISFKSEEYATYGTAVHLYDPAGDTWGSSLRTLLNTATDAVVGLVTNTETLVIATGSEVDYATDSSTWARQSGQGVKYLVFWNDLLWGITQAGALYFTNDLTLAWSADAQLQLPDDYVTGLLVARGPDREQHIYAVTKVGLYVHDSANSRFIETDLQLPFHPDGGKGLEVFRGQTFTSAGNAIYQFEAGSDRTFVDTMGPDLDDGLPQDRRGSISALTKTHNDLIAVIDSTGTSGVSDLGLRVSRGAGFHHGVTFPALPGVSHILGWNNRGWENKWVSTSSSKAITAIDVSNSNSFYRMWWAWDERVYYMNLPVDIINPIQISSQEFGSSAVLETPWVDFNIQNQRKLALAAILETINPSASETVKIEYATNYVESYTEVATQTTTGETTYQLPVAGDAKGIPFRAWKWRITLARGSNVGDTPQMVKLTLSWRPRIETLYGITANLDFRRDWDGKSPSEQFRNLNTTLGADELIRVSYRDDVTGDQNYLMDVVDLNTVEISGSVDYGLLRVTFAEPQHPIGRM